MKYIRAGNQIYKIIKEKEGYFELRDALDIRMKCYTFMPKREHDYKIADTIEELCDEFVWVSIENEYHNRKANEYGLRTSKMQVNSPQMKTIYGAIWTDKGLIYVAKMNDKGELELI